MFKISVDPSMTYVDESDVFFSDFSLTHQNTKNSVGSVVQCRIELYDVVFPCSVTDL